MNVVSFSKYLIALHSLFHLKEVLYSFSLASPHARLTVVLRATVKWHGKSGPLWQERRDTGTVGW